MFQPQTGYLQLHPTKPDQQLDEQANHDSQASQDFPKSPGDDGASRSVSHPLPDAVHEGNGTDVEVR